MSAGEDAGSELAPGSCPMCGAETLPADVECGECGERLPRRFRSIQQSEGDLPDHTAQKRVLGVLLLLISLPVLAAGLIGAALSADPMGRILLTAAAFPGGFGVWNALLLISTGRGAKMHRWDEAAATTENQVE